MANVKISELTALTPPDAADLVPVTDSSASQTKRTTVGEIVGIVNGDVDVANDGTATISELPVSKLQDGAARQLLQTDAAGTGVEWTSNVDVPGTLDVTGAATFDGNVVITGDLTVEGASTILETETVKVEDKNIELGVVASPTDVTADGGGITLKGTTDKTLNWLDATDSWTSSEHIDLAGAKEYRIAGNKVIDATSLGSGVVSSNLTSVGTISSGTWQGTTIATGYGGTGQTSYIDGQLLIGNSTGSTLSKATLTAGTGISVTNGNGSITLAIDSDTAIADITTTATSGTLPTADGTVTIADATTPTVTELLEYCVELEAKLEAALAALRTVGVIAT